MNTKLTLNLDKGIIEKEKNYAKDHNISLSKIFKKIIDISFHSAGK